jgi:Arc/MetJ family transcription regulator
MTEEQLDALRHLIKQEIDAAQIDGMEHGVWGWADKNARRRMARVER